MESMIQQHVAVRVRLFSGFALLIAICFATIVAPPAASAQAAAESGVSKRTILVMDHATLQRHLRALGYKTKGKIAVEMAQSGDSRFRTFPHFSSSFSVNGITFPYTMLGYPPKSGRKAAFASVVIPLRMNFVGFGDQGDVNVTFDPATAVTNIVHSPMYREANFVNGYGQFGQMMQRAAFWNMMDKERHWSVSMATPRVLPTLDVEVTPETGNLFQDSNGNFFGNVSGSFMDALAKMIIQIEHFPADELPIFVTQDVTAEALGYHTVYPVTNSDHSVALQTFIYTSWLDPALVDPLLADVSTFNHENLEWINDPFGVNIVPTWQYPPVSDPRSTCSGNQLMEVGDPQGNGATFDDFPTIVVPIDGVQYHLQQLVLFQWFTDEVPSSAENGWYTFPDPSSITTPATYCQ